MTGSRASVRRVATIIFVVALCGSLAAAQWAGDRAKYSQQAVDEYEQKIEDQFAKVLRDPQSADYAAINATKKARDLAVAEHQERARVAGFYEAVSLVTLIIFFGVFGAVERWREVEAVGRKRVMTKATLLTLACGVLLLFPPSRPVFTFIPRVLSEVGVPGLGQEAGIFAPSALGWVLAVLTVWLLAFANLPADEED
jgi:hypothetical protein